MADELKVTLCVEEERERARTRVSVRRVRDYGNEKERERDRERSSSRIVDMQDTKCLLPKVEDSESRRLDLAVFTRVSSMSLLTDAKNLVISIIQRNNVPFRRIKLRRAAVNVSCHLRLIEG